MLLTSSKSCVTLRRSAVTRAKYIHWCHERPIFEFFATPDLDFQRPARLKASITTMETHTRATKALPDSISNFRTLADEIIAHAQLSYRPNTAPAAAPDPTPDEHLVHETGKLLEHLHPVVPADESPRCGSQAAQTPPHCQTSPSATPSSNDDMWELEEPVGALPSEQSAFSAILAPLESVATDAPSDQLATLLQQQEQIFVRHADVQAPSEAPVLKPMMQVLYVQVGPFEVRPSVGRELPIGRNYQNLNITSISRLAGYVGRDEHGLYVREVPEMPEYGLHPSRNGIWVKQPDEDAFRRLAPGEAARVTKESVVRLGGNGSDPEKGYPVVVV